MSNYALTNCNIIDGVSCDVKKDMTILVSGGKIERIGKASEVKLPADYINLNISDKYVMPGLINAHAHLFGSGKPMKAIRGGKSQEKVVSMLKTKVGRKILDSMVKNHALTALEFLDKKGCAHVGTASSEKKRDDFPIVGKNGIQIAFLSYTFSINGKPVPTGKEYLVNYNSRMEGDKCTDFRLLNFNKLMEEIKKNNNYMNFDEVELKELKRLEVLMHKLLHTEICEAFYA